MIERKIPSSDELLPVLGIGTWKTFDADTASFPDLTSVLNIMHASGGQMIDTSPMYGRAEEVIGKLTNPLKFKNDFFYATKVWTTGRTKGITQMKESIHKMQRESIDLIQIHNLQDWKTHLKTLIEWKEKGIIRYIGITHYMDTMHEELESILRNEKIDFVQFNYSIDSTHAEKRLLAVAADLGVATIINRPFGISGLFKKLSTNEIPAWAHEAGIITWSAFFLKYIISHPAVTCVIPATSNPAHAKDNFETGTGVLPDEKMRQKMREMISKLLV